MLKKALYTLSIVSISTAALASGYQISEYSTTNLGRSFAGAGVVGDDFSAMGYNPAGMSINATSGIQGGAAGILLHSDYKNNATGEKHSSKMGRVLPHFFGQYKANDKLTLGTGFYTPYGLITDYNNDWFGSDHGILSALKVMNFSVGASYQFHPMFSVGAAVNAQYIHARLTGTKAGGMMTTDMDGDDAGVGYMLGATFTPQRNIRLGVSYRSKVSHELRGDLAIGTPLGNQEMDIKAKVTTPELVLISGAVDVNEKLTLSASARWTKWNRFKNLDVINRAVNVAVSSTHENWKNTWFYSIGADYKINENWTVRLGTAYDETVIKAPEFRTVRVPDGRRIFASLGLSYTTGNWQYDLGYTHVWMRHGNAHGGERENPMDKNSPSKDANVRYSHAGAYMGGFSIQYKF